ncbi:MAG TPA: 30S ribosomal protein S21 [Rubricoccaceae bacterium]
MSVGIKVRDKESIDRALRRFKRVVNRARTLRTFRENMAFTKPSETKRLERKEAAKKARRANRRMY